MKYFQLIFLFAAPSLFAQPSLSIETCQQMARVNYPLIQQHILINLSEQYSISNIGKAWLPQIAFNAQATYQSDVVHIPAAMPGLDIPSLSKDQYRATIDVSQTIYDGGASRSQRKITEAANEIDRQNVEVNLYTLRERINQLFFGILIINEQIKQLDILEKDLQTSMSLVNALLKNGTATRTDVDAVQVEALNVHQKRTEFIAFRKAYTEMLAAMIGETLDENVILLKPQEIILQSETRITRPEIAFFARQKELFDAQSDMIQARNMPRLSLFVQGGYGKPGLNMLSNKFEPFAIGGIRLNWNFGNLYSAKNDRDLLDINKTMTVLQQETFEFNTNLQLKQVWNEIQKAKELMQRDDEIINLRQNIKKASESKYANGAYTINDLVKDINAESQSRQARIVHEVQYLMSLYQYRTIAGK